jgi:hypothetical protein
MPRKNRTTFGYILNFDHIDKKNVDDLQKHINSILFYTNEMCLKRNVKGMTLKSFKIISCGHEELDFTGCKLSFTFTFGSNTPCSVRTYRKYFTNELLEYLNN